MRNFCTTILCLGIYKKHNTSYYTLYSRYLLFANRSSGASRVKIYISINILYYVNINSGCYVCNNMCAMYLRLYLYNIIIICLRDTCDVIVMCTRYILHIFRYSHSTYILLYSQSAPFIYHLSACAQISAWHVI